MGGYAVFAVSALVSVLLAQVGDASAVSWPSVIAALSGGGFSLWYGWYTTSVTMPKMQADNNIALTKMNADNNGMVERIVNDFREEMKLERQFHDGQINRLVNQIDRLAVTKPGPGQAGPIVG